MRSSLKMSGPPVLRRVYVWLSTQKCCTPDSDQCSLNVFCYQMLIEIWEITFWVRRSWGGASRRGSCWWRPPRWGRGRGRGGRSSPAAARSPPQTCPPASSDGRRSSSRSRRTSTSADASTCRQSPQFADWKLYHFCHYDCSVANQNLNTEKAGVSPGFMITLFGES